MGALGQLVLGVAEIVSDEVRAAKKAALEAAVHTGWRLMLLGVAAALLFVGCIAVLYGFYQLISTASDPVLAAFTIGAAGIGSGVLFAVVVLRNVGCETRGRR